MRVCCSSTSRTRPPSSHGFGRLEVGPSCVLTSIIEFSDFCKPPYVLPFAFPYTISPYEPSHGFPRPHKILYVYDCIYAVRRQIKEEDLQWGLSGVPSVSLLVSDEIVCSIHSYHFGLTINPGVAGCFL